jgi:hypothetical protein
MNTNLVKSALFAPMMAMVLATSLGLSGSRTARAELMQRQTTSQLNFTDPELVQLNETAQRNYSVMLGANIGAGARSDLEESQKKWLIEISKCPNRECFKRLLIERINAICRYPVLMGVFPDCRTIGEFHSP